MDILFLIIYLNLYLYKIGTFRWSKQNERRSKNGDDVLSGIHLSRSGKN